MKILIVTAMVLFSCHLYGQDWNKIAKMSEYKTDSILAHNWAVADSMYRAIDSSIALHNAWVKDIVMVRGLTKQGLRAIRHDAFWRLKFRYAHEIGKMIRQYRNNYTYTRILL